MTEGKRTTRPRVMVLFAPGTNRDREAALACELAGGAPEIVPINHLSTGSRQMSDYQMLVIPGGFSYGDDLGAGRLWANDLYHRFRDELDQFVSLGKPVLGICNGFQALVKAGYLPGPAPVQQVTLTHNAGGRFECRWVRLRANGSSHCLFTQDMAEDIYCPVAHGEGRFWTGNAATHQVLEAEGLIALRYVNAHGDPDMSIEASVAPTAGYPSNPNGSLADIAGICNASGNILGLMPHPEDHVLTWQHPNVARGWRGGLGLDIFRNGIRAAERFLGAFS